MAQRTERFGVRLTSDERALLEQLAQREERSPSDVVRRLVRQAIKATSDDRRAQQVGVST